MDDATIAIMAGSFEMFIATFDKGLTSMENLSLAIQVGSDDIAKYIIDNSQRGDYENSMTILYTAVYDRIDVLKHIIARGVKKYTYIASAINMAIVHNHLQIMELLIDSFGYDISKNGTAFYDSVRMGNRDAVDILVKRGAGIFARNQRAINMAIERNHTHLIRYFVSLGSYDPDIDPHEYIGVLDERHFGMLNDYQGLIRIILRRCRKYDWHADITIIATC